MMARKTRDKAHVMTQPDGDPPKHRTHHRATPNNVTIRTGIVVQDDEEVMELRMPVASTGDVRNEGDDPLARSEIQGMARQINNGNIGVFPEHGVDDTIAGGHYSQFEKLGVWTNAEVESDAASDGEDLLVATARMPDPNTLPDLGQYRTALGILKEQAARGIPIDSSIGWRADEDAPGGNDLLEVSIVGIGADPRTNTAGADPVSAVTRAAVDAGADPDQLVAAVRDAVDAARPLGPPSDPERFDTYDECVAALADDPDLSREDAEEICGAWESAKDDDDGRAVYDVNGTDVSITPPDVMVNTAEAVEDNRNSIPDDCGTGVGDRRVTQILNDAVGPDVVTEMAAYLTSHEEDVTASGPPTDWSAEEWGDCGNAQYAKWGGTGSGEMLEWAQGKANAVADARGDDLPYPNQSTNGMSTESDPDSSGTDTDAEQDATDGETETETETRAPEDVTEDDLLTFTAMHLDGMDESDLGEAIDAADASYIGECDPEALADLVSTATGAEYEAVVDAMDALMEGGENEYGDKDDDEEEDDEGDDRNADTDDGGSDLAAEVAALREDLDELRERQDTGESPGDTTQTPDDGDDQGERDADAGEESAAETDTADDSTTLRDGWLS